MSRSNPDRLYDVHIAFLHLLQDMYLADESFEDTFCDRQRTLFTALQAYSQLSFESLLGAFEPAAHQDLINELLAAATQTTSKNDAVLYATLFLGFLDEQSGNREAALARYQVLHARISRGSQMRPRLDEALERVAGAKPEHQQE